MGMGKEESTWYKLFQVSRNAILLLVGFIPKKREKSVSKNPYAVELCGIQFLLTFTQFPTSKI